MVHNRHKAALEAAHVAAAAAHLQLQEVKAAEQKKSTEQLRIKDIEDCAVLRLPFDEKKERLLQLAVSQRQASMRLTFKVFLLHHQTMHSNNFLGLSYAVHHAVAYRHFLVCLQEHREATSGLLTDFENLSAMASAQDAALVSNRQTIAQLQVGILCCWEARQVSSVLCGTVLHQTLATVLAG